jgi:hypothetical protein
MKAYELPNQTKLNGYTHKLVVTHEDLTTTTANTAQSVTLLSLDQGDVIQDAAFKLVTAFSDASDSAFNTTTLAVGDDDVDEFIDETEVNENGTEIFYAGPVADSIPKVYNAPTDGPVTATFMSMAAKSLSDLDAGEVHIYLKVAKLADL